ncbi:zf-TFIIB domain-containing protein [Desulfobulbus sp. TB]|nr:zf-TFIIB domain-containing protein [Desulfobulbus sp. TB]
MKCTSCKKGSLIPAYLDQLFPCHTCSHCAGNLVMLSDYLRWLEDNENPDFIHASDAVVEAEETSSVMICPKSSALMVKYKISQHNDHRLDLSSAINAVWLDKGEWELLKKEGLAGKLNEIFTASWQNSVREAQISDTLTMLYEKKFGENYEKIKIFKEMIDKMERKSEVIAYLIAEDPYKI